VQRKRAKKINSPRAMLPVIVLLSAAVNFGVVFGILLAFLASVGRFPGWALVACLPLFILQQALALGIGLALGVVNVFVRDVGHVVAVALQVGFWLTPVVYPQAILGAAARRLLEWNPMTRIVGTYQQIVLTGTWPSWMPLLPELVLVAVALGAGMITFRRLSAEMADYL
jgi:lipopolysaccharide transport system permease protein